MLSAELSKGWGWGSPSDLIKSEPFQFFSGRVLIWHTSLYEGTVVSTGTCNGTMPSPTITCVAGLPASGKSTWLVAQSRLTGAKVFDDFKANSIGDDPAFASSRHIPALRRAVAEGHSCLIADIDFCRDSARVDALVFLTEQFMTVSVEWVFFACDQTACRENVLLDATRDVRARLAAIDRFACLYRIPAEIAPVPVWRP